MHYLGPTQKNDTHTTDRLLLIGVRNPPRGDDTMGAALVTAVQARPVPGLLCRHAHGLHLALLDDLHAADVVIVADTSL
jgi:Ni,Fe-hydrogenase maturation factor